MFDKINNIKLLQNEPLSKHSSFNVGGNSKFLISAYTIDSLLDVLYYCKQHYIKHKVIGNGSNLLFDDLGFNGAIIKYENTYKQIKNNTLYVNCGISLSELIQFTIQQGLSGFEFCIGVPAMLGGAIYNNLGAYDNEISTHIDHVTVLRKNCIVYLSKDECDFKYHSSIFQKNNDIILASTFLLPPQDKNVIFKTASNFLLKRKTSQPLEFANAGSIFKREPAIIPAQLIDEAGLKGLQINDAQISTKHSGFIINLGNAKCNDILNLINLIKNKIYEKYNIILHEEIEYCPYF